MEHVREGGGEKEIISNILPLSRRLDLKRKTIIPHVHLGNWTDGFLQNYRLGLGMKTNAKQTNSDFQLDQAGVAGVSVEEGKRRMTKPRGKILGDLL